MVEHHAVNVVVVGSNPTGGAIKKRKTWYNSQYMNMSRKKFVFLFLISAFAFMFLSNALFGTDARVFPQPPESFLGNEPPIVWKSVGYKILLPIKLVLVGPMLATGNFLREDPPPP